MGMGIRVWGYLNYILSIENTLVNSMHMWDKFSGGFCCWVKEKNKAVDWGKQEYNMSNVDEVGIQLWNKGTHWGHRTSSSSCCPSYRTSTQVNDNVIKQCWKCKGSEQHQGWCNKCSGLCSSRTNWGGVGRGDRHALGDVWNHKEDLG